MKTELLKMVKLLAPAALALAGLMLGPGTAFGASQGRANGGGFRTGHSYSGSDHGSFGGGGLYGGRGYYGGRAVAGFYNGRYGRDYYRSSFRIGIYGAPGYGYAGPVCNSTGFYDQEGYWHRYPGCVVPSNGY